METIAFQVLDDNGYKTILKFRTNENGKGEFFDLTPGYGEKYAGILKNIGIQLNSNKMILPIENPKEFIELAPKFYSGSYERWKKIK